MPTQQVLTGSCLLLALSRPRVDLYISSQDQQEAEEHNSHTLSQPLAVTRKESQHFRVDTSKLDLLEKYDTIATLITEGDFDYGSSCTYKV